VYRYYIIYFETRSIFKLRRKSSALGRGWIFHTNEIQKFHTVYRYTLRVLHRLKMSISTPTTGKSRESIFSIKVSYTTNSISSFFFFFFSAWKLEFAYTTGSFHGRRPFRLGEFIAVNRSALVVYPNAVYTRDDITCKTVVDLDIYIYNILYYITRPGESCTSILYIYIHVICIHLFLFFAPPANIVR